MKFQMKGLKIDDRGKIGSKNEKKLFYISFESLGSGGCLLVDFKDGTKKSYGDEYFCTVEWNQATDYKYQEGIELENPMTVHHSYQ